MQPKSETIEAIRKLNPTASPDFLVAFPTDELARYLDRLTMSAVRERNAPPDDLVLLADLPNEGPSHDRHRPG